MYSESVNQLNKFLKEIEKLKWIPLDIVALFKTDNIFTLINILKLIEEGKTFIPREFILVMKLIDIEEYINF